MIWLVCGLAVAGSWLVYDVAGRRNWDTRFSVFIGMEYGIVAAISIIGTAILTK